jgi:alpha-beta hydrolase superfamily lysophospholipase
MSITDFNHLYLHGFASGPGSTKAQFFKAKVAEQKAVFVVPDLNQPSFREMTISQQKKVAMNNVAKLRDRPIVLWGSSMGGLVATLLAHQNRSLVRALILLAPGFDIASRWQELIGAENLKRWREEGQFQFFHYALKRDEKLDYGFFADCLFHQTTNLKLECPTIVFHGVNDQTVPVRTSREFVSLNAPNAKLFELEDGHELIDSLDLIWKASLHFINQISLDENPA